MDDLTVERVLRTVEAIPRGRVASYGQVGDVCGVGPRLVGRIMSQWGSGVTWWRVTSADGDLPAPLLARARDAWDEEGIALKPNGRGCRIARYRADHEQLVADARRAWADLPEEGGPARDENLHDPTSVTPRSSPVRPVVTSGTARRQPDPFPCRPVFRAQGSSSPRPAVHHPVHDRAFRGGPVHVGTTLQRNSSAAAPLWEQAFAAWAWRHAVGSRPVHLDARPGADGDGSAASRPRLRGADGAVVRDLGEIGAGGRTFDLADPTTPPWLWVEGAADLRWWIDDEIVLPHVTAVVPTFCREDDATAQARAFADMPFVARVLVVDQGGTLAGHAPFSELVKEHRPRGRATGIELLEQPNLGGSGGYARGMLASLDDPSQAVFLSDDDALISEESLRRLLTFQALAEAPTILGTGLLDAGSPADAPTLLTAAEHVERRTFFWRSADGMHGPLDLAGTTPADWDALLPRTAADYSGWWGTLLPPGAVGTLGLPAPFFLKWDDAEYGLRASASGYSTMVLPGASVTHPSWDAYRTQMSWSARILHRNRLATAAAHRAGRGVLADSFAHQLKHVLSGLHLTACLWDEGARAALAGPEAWLGRDLGTARADGQAMVDAWHERQRSRTEGLEPTRTSPLSLPAGALRALLRVLSPARAPRSVLQIPASEVSWRTVLGADAVIITSAQGERIDAFAIDGHDDRSLLLRVLRTHVRLALRWGRLRRRYARALPRWTTAGAWREILERADTEHQSTDHQSTQERTDEIADASQEGGR